MTTLMTSGSWLQDYEASWGHCYAATRRIIGSTGVILPLGDRRFASADWTTFETYGEEQVTFTWSEAITAFDTPFDPRDPASYQGIVPVVTFNGSDEEADTPDLTYWSPLSNPGSWGAWVKIVDNTQGSQTLFGKYDVTGNQKEFVLYISGFTAGKEQPVFYDENAASDDSIFTKADNTLNNNQWYHIVFTWDGGTSGSGINCYRDGVVIASTDTTQAFVQCRDLADRLFLGAFDDSSTNSYFEGSMAGACCGPIYAQNKELTPDEVAQLYALQRGYVGV
jgi:hypothetical protein